MRTMQRLLGAALCVGVALAVCAVWIDPRFSYFVDDGPAHMLRSVLVDHAIRRGDWFPRWLPELQFGYGYPLLNFYPPAIYYLAEPLVLGGMSVYRSLQFIGTGVVVLGAVGAYVLGLVVFRSAFAASLVGTAYALAPYPFITNLYLRTALPEALALGVAPWLLASTVCAVRTREAIGQIGMALSIAAMILSHLLSALLWLPLAAFTAVAYGAAGRWPLRAQAPTALVALLGAGLAAFFWMPAVTEVSAVQSELGRLSGQHLLFSPFAGPSLSASLPFDTGLTYPFQESGVQGPQKPSLAQVTLVAGGLLVAALARVVEARPGQLRHRPGDPHRPSLSPLLVVAGALCAGSLAVNTTWSSALWSAKGPLAFAQFPWRFLGPLSLSVGLLAAWPLSSIRSHRWLAYVSGAALCGFLAYNSLGSQPWTVRDHDPTARPSPAVQLRSAEGETVGHSTTTTSGEYLPRSVELSLPRREGIGGRSAYERLFPEAGWVAGRVWPHAGEVDILSVSDSVGATTAAVEVVGAGAAEVAFRTLHFLGWSATVDGTPASMRTAPYEPAVSHGHGFIIVPVPAGRHTVQLRLDSTLPRSAGHLLSTASLVALMGLSLFAVRKTTGAFTSTILSIVTLVAGLLLLLLISHAVGLPRVLASGSGAPAGLAFDLLAQPFSSGQTQTQTGPVGSNPNRIGREVIAGHGRRLIYGPSNYTLEWRVAVPPRATFQAGLAIDPRNWSVPALGGVRYLVEVEDTGRSQTLLDITLSPFSTPADRGWRFAHVGLDRYANRTVTLRLRTEATETEYGGWVGWATPAIYVDGSARYPPPPSVSPAILEAPMR